MSPQVRCDHWAKTKLGRWVKLALIAATVMICLWWHDTAEAFEPWWIQNHMEAELWSGPAGEAQSFGKVQQWNYFKVVLPQGNSTRLHVWNPKTNNYAYIDAKAVGPSGPPPKETNVVQNPLPAQSPAPQGMEQASAFQPWLGRTQVATELWSGIDTKAISFGRIARGTDLQVISERKENRYHVINQATKNYAYVDADAVIPKTTNETGDIATQKQPNTSAERKMPKTANGYEGWWVSNFRETELWTGQETADANMGTIPQFRRFLVVEPQKGDRLKVWYPEKDIFGYLEASAVGPSCPSVWVNPQYIKDEKQALSQGRSIGEKTYVRSLPIFDDETELRKLPSNTPVNVTKAVTATDGTEWYMLEKGEYILASEVRLPRVPGQYFSGRWIDVDLDEPTIVTAYDGKKVVKTSLAIKGVNKYPTPVGNFKILRRVANETMDSETIGIPRDDPGGYLLKNVLYTQYFTNDGASLHYNYWRGTFGYPGSHGCLGLSLEDSKWFWDWSEVGTPVIVRSNSGGQMIQTSTSTEAAGGG